MAMKVLKAVDNKAFKTSSLKNMTFYKRKFGLPCPVDSGGFSTVLHINLNGQDKAFRIILKKINKVEAQYRLFKNALKNDTSGYFVDFDFYPNELNTGDNNYHCMIMDWVNGVDLKKYVEKNISLPYRIKNTAQSFLSMMNYLYSKSISHGDLHHGNIMVKPTGKLVLIDYDGLYIPNMGQYKDTIKGKVGYQHPTLRNANNLKNSHLDYFSAIVIYLSLLAIAEKPTLFSSQKVGGNDEGFLFSPEELKNPNSAIFRQLDTMSSEVKKYKNILLQALKVRQLQQIPKIGGSSALVLSNNNTNNIVPTPNFLKKIQIRRI